MNDLAATVRKAYNDYEFHLVYHGINNFCTINLSKLYIDITKDRVYVEKKDSKARRSAQTAMYFVLSSLTRLVAPLITFTAEEIWQSMPHKATDVKESVFLNDMPAYDESLAFAEVCEKWNKLFDNRDVVMKALEIARAEKLIGKSLDAKVTVYTTDNDVYELLNTFAGELATVYIVSKAVIVNGNAPEGAYAEEDSAVAVKVEPADGKKCDRCWAYAENGIETEEGGFLCDRCRAIVE
jgi:isoleucyl-tRNA synthetase